MDILTPSHIEAQDAEVFAAIQNEDRRQRQNLELIASENYASKAVREAMGCVMTNKYAEGYPGKRYYGGCEYVDVAENLAIDRLKQIFKADHANVQVHAGAQANMAVFMAVLQPGDTVLGMSLAHGGHLTHGTKVSFSGKLYNAVAYGVRKDTELIDYDEVRSLAREHKPKMIIAGASAYPRTMDYAPFRDIADEIGAVFMVDMAHIAGLVAVDLHPSPVPLADFVTSTTHKTLRGPRGGMILANDEAIAKKINSAIFPGLQGGPLMHVVAAKATAFLEALCPEFKLYARNVVENAVALGKSLRARGYDLVTGGTDNHLILVDLRTQSLTGKAAEASLSRAGITCNKNGVPFDSQKPTVTSGIRLGSPACTSRGFGRAEFKEVGTMIADVLDGLRTSGDEQNGAQEAEVRERALALTRRFPIYM